MLLSPLPFEYVILLDPGDRVRRAAKRSTESRIRASMVKPDKAAKDAGA